MPLTLQPNESVLWEGRMVYPYRFPILTVICFIGVGVFAEYGISWWIPAFILFVFSIFLLVLSLIALTDRNVGYYVTNLRIVREQGAIRKKGGELPLQNLVTVRVKADFLNSVRGVGSIHFESSSGEGLIFDRVKDPAAVKETALGAKSRQTTFS